VNDGVTDNQLALQSISSTFTISFFTTTERFTDFGKLIFRGRFHQHTREAFFSHRMSFFGTQIGQMVNSIWQILAHKLGLNYVGEIEQRFFLTNAVCWRLFDWQTKFGEIDP